MNNERQIRFLYPPFILIGSLLTGLGFDNCKTIDWPFALIKINDSKDLIAIIIGGGALVLVLGYIIGTITITLLRLIFISNKGIYEVDLKQDFEDIGEIILKNEKEKIKGKEKLYTFATFDHGFLSDNIHRWIQRRWSSFHTSANAVTSLVLSFIIGLIVDINIWTPWTPILVILTIMYIYHGHRARKETIEMISFQAKIKKNGEVNV